MQTILVVGAALLALAITPTALADAPAHTIEEFSRRRFLSAALARPAEATFASTSAYLNTCAS